MDVKKILADIKKVAFDVVPGTIAPAIPTAQAAPVAPAAPAAAPVSYTLLDGTVINIAQAGQVPAVGDTVTIGDVPAPAGILTMEDGSTITTDMNGVITEVGAADPATQDLSQAPIVPTMDERIAALEAKINQLSQPAKMAAVKKEEVKVIEVVAEAAKEVAVISKTEFEAANEKLTARFDSLLGLVEKFISGPSAQPATLTGAKKARFERDAEKAKEAQEKEERMLGIAEMIKENKAQY